jgi:hypothetical protein
MGHEQRFPPLRLNVRCRLGQATFIGTDGKGREAPSAVIPALAPERGSSTQSGHSRSLTSGADAAYLLVTIPVGPAPETVRMNHNSYRVGPQSAPRRR